jgi:hypothetical protein
MLPTTDLSSMPSPARNTILASQADFLQADQGHVRQSKNSTVDSRLRHFARWLGGQGYDQQSARSIKEGVAFDLIGAYLAWVRKGNSLPHSSTSLLSGQSLHNYVNAAAHCVSLLTEQPCIIRDPTTFQQRRVHMHPYIREQRDAWSVPKPRKEPYTLDMFQALAHHLHSQQDRLATFLTKDNAVFYWAQLGLFTGSWVSEYAQTCLRAGTQFNAIPTTPNAGIWAGQALGFIRSDLVFYSAQHELVPLSKVAKSQRKELLTSVHIRCCFDKSALC